MQPEHYCLLQEVILDSVLAARSSGLTSLKDSPYAMSSQTATRSAPIRSTFFSPNNADNRGGGNEQRADEEDKLGQRDLRERSGFLY